MHRGKEAKEAKEAKQGVKTEGRVAIWRSRFSSAGIDAKENVREFGVYIIITIFTMA